jgi:hypothetical protein
MTTAEAGITTGEDGKTKACVSMKFPGSRSLTFPVDITPLTHVGLQIVLAAQYKPTVFDGGIPGLNGGERGAGRQPNSFLITQKSNGGSRA